MDKEFFTAVNRNEAVQITTLSFGVLANVDALLVIYPFQVTYRPKSQPFNWWNKDVDKHDAQYLEANV